MTAEALLWLDVETTGLSHEEDDLLEVAAVATLFDAELTELGAFHSVVAMPMVSITAIHPDVLEMHAKNGLWRDCAKGQPLTNVSNMFGDFLRRWELLYGPTVYLAGRSVHFDRAWLPVLGAAADRSRWIDHLALSHRHFDLTAIKAFAGLAGITVDAPEDAHRALADVEADIALARRLIRITRDP